MEKNKTLDLTLTSREIWLGLLVIGGFFFCFYQDNEVYKREVYGMLASVFGALLGFVITTTSIIIILLKSEELQIIRESKYLPVIYNTLTQTSIFLGLTTVIIIIGYIFDNSNFNSRLPLLYFIRFVVTATLIYSTLYVLKVINILNSAMILYTQTFNNK